MERPKVVLIIGSGMGSLSAAVLLASKGIEVKVVEQNWQAGGCTTSYWRKGYVFEAGATTLVGLGKGMPLQYVLDQTGISICARQLNPPMRVHWSDGTQLTRFEDINDWIQEAERVFGREGQREFWEECFQVSQFVWDNALKQTRFPPTRIGDLWQSLKSFSLAQIKHGPSAFLTVETILRKHKLHQNKRFVDFINEQLLITAQNHMQEVNFLFGAAALCYTNYPNYYVDGGLAQLVNPFVQYIKDHNGEVIFRERVEQVKQTDTGYEVKTSKSIYQADFVISGLPINNTLDIFPEVKRPSHQKKMMLSKQLNSAFQMGIAFQPHKEWDCLHHQIHLEKPLVGTSSASIFISLNHPEDHSRADVKGEAVMSVSTHLPDPEKNMVKSEEIEQAIMEVLVAHDFLKPENIKYMHSSSPKSWVKWTGRKWGFVGGYPQFRKIKPWQMLDARLDNKGAYLVGDTAYPGQGIPGVTLSGIIAVEKLLSDHL